MWSGSAWRGERKAKGSVSDGSRLHLVVCNEHHGEAKRTAQDTERRPHVFPLIDVETGEWLVEQEERRPVHQRPRKGRPLLLAARQLMRIATAKAFEPYQTQCLIDCSAAFDTTESRDRRRKDEFQTLSHCHVRPQREILKHESEVAPARRHENRRTAGRQLAVDPYVPGIRDIESGDNPQQSRFAGSALPDERDRIGCCQLQRHVPEEDLPFPSLADILEAKQIIHARAHDLTPIAITNGPTTTAVWTSARAATCAGGAFAISVST